MDEMNFPIFNANNFDITDMDKIVSQCEYYTISNGIPQTQHLLSIIHLNARSVKNKFDEIQHLLTVSGVDWSIICISETWLKSNLLDFFNLDKYNLFASCRDGGEGGGTLIYVNKIFETKERKDLQCSLNESTFVEINIPNIPKRSVIVGDIYKPPSFSHTLFMECLEKTLAVIEKEQRLVVLSGDFNYNLFNIDQDQQVINFSNLLASYSFHPTICKATRSQNEHHSLLDNIFTNNPSTYCKSGVILDDLSDHFPIFTYLTYFTVHSKRHSMKKITFDKSKSSELNEFLIDRLQNFQSHTDANAACEDIVSCYLEGINACSKEIKISTRRNSVKPWISAALLCSINNKNKLYKKFLKSPNIENEQKFKRVRNILTNLLRDAKRLYYQSKIDENKDNSKKVWELLNEVINKRKSNNVEMPSTFIDSTGKLYKEQAVAEGFNDFFSSIGSELESNMPPPDSSALEHLNEPIYDDFNTALRTTSEEVETIIQGLNPVGGGVDKISTNILLLTYRRILPHLTFFFNLCLTTSVFPDQLKVAVIKPIFKAGDRNLFNNYRPISLLPILSKVLEKILYSFIIAYINEKNLLNPLQFGFRKRHSTYMPIAHMFDQITNSLQNNLVSCVLYLDLKKAFDTVNLTILLQKLFYMGIKGNLYKIMESYLTNRKQKTDVSSFVSSYRQVKIGVPQGSILGPLLFILYINDLSNVSSDASFYLFADDTAILLKAANVLELQTKLNRLLPLVTRWFLANRLTLNTTKTNYQIYARLPVEDLEIELNQAKIERKKAIKYLGVTVDEDLKWTNHVNNVSKVISRNIGIMARARFYLTASQLKLLYNTLVLPHLNYCAAVWGNNYMTRINKLIKLQKRALRIIDGKHYVYPSRELFIKYRMLKFPDIVNEQQIVILLGFLNQTLPSSILDMFSYHVPVGTRAVQHFDVPYAATNYRAFSLSIAAPKAWNSVVCILFNDINDVPRNKTTFKKYVRNFLVDKY